MVELLSFSVPYPKHKNQLLSMNLVQRLHWATISKLKNQYKNMLKEWFISKPENKYSSMTVVFELLRHNKRVLDSDNTGFVIKWSIDAIKELEWLHDDDQITYCVKPSVVSQEENETMIRVICYKEDE